MVVFTKNTSTTVIMTLTDKVTIASPYYLMVLDSRSGYAQQAFLITDTSDYPFRYNRFTIEEGVDFTAPKGIYKYRVLEKSTASTTITGDEVVLETGIAVVNDDVAETYDTFTTTPANVIFENEQ